MKNEKEVIKTLNEICITEQQEKGLKEYLQDCLEFEREISIEDFKTYYSHYCYEHKFYKDSF